MYSKCRIPEEAEQELQRILSKLKMQTVCLETDKKLTSEAKKYICACELFANNIDQMCGDF